MNRGSLESEADYNWNTSACVFNNDSLEMVNPDIVLGTNLAERRAKSLKGF
jgi:hypothetical protein